MKIFTICLIFILASALMYSQDGLPSSRKGKEPTSFLEVPPVLKSRIELFFNSLMKDDVKKSYDDLLTNSPISRQRSDIDNLLAQTKRALEIYGKIEGYEAVNAEVATDSYIRLRYLGLHSNFPVRWIFTFYRSPQKEWIITNVKFDDLSEYFFKGD